MYDPEEPMAGSTSSTLLRVCHYKPSTSTAHEVLFPAHTDSTLLTLSPLSPQAPGLQLQAADGEWLDVECGAHRVLDVEVHAGDYLGILSRGFYPALRHRVVRPAGGVSRLSMPLLLRPRDEWRRGRGWLQYTEREDDLTSSDDDEEES